MKQKAFHKYMSWYYPMVCIENEADIGKVLVSLYSKYEEECKLIETTEHSFVIDFGWRMEWLIIPSISEVGKLLVLEDGFFGADLDPSSHDSIKYTFSRGVIQGDLLAIFLYYLYKQNDFEIMKFIMKYPNYKEMLADFSQKKGKQIVPYKKQLKIFKSWINEGLTSTTLK